jgi:F-type H+-transporting ATPase subunit b
LEHETAAETHAATGFEAFVSDPAFWALVGLLIFIGVLVWKKIPGVLTKSLDDRAAKISAELASAEALRIEAENKLAEARKREMQAEADAAEIVEAAKREAAQVAAAAKVALEENLARRQKLAEERIARAEADAIRDVKVAAIDTASKAAAALLTEQLTGKAADAQFAASLETVKKALS